MKQLFRIALCGYLALLTPLAVATLPQTINYQGYLTSSTNVPVNTLVNMTFRLYAASAGDASIWQETQSGIAVTNGAFNVALGSVTAFGLPFGAPYFLSVQVNADAEMSPRQPLRAVPYAMSAGAIDAIGNLTLPVSTPTAGNIMKGAESFIHNSGFSNTYLGESAGNFSSNGAGNTGVGKTALRNIASGFQNTGIGHAALIQNTGGVNNTAIGYDALVSNVDGGSNTALGAGALSQSTGHGNIAIGLLAGQYIQSGGNNIMIGNSGVANDVGIVRIGTAQAKTLIAGIRGVTPDLPGVLPVVIDGNGQLGTAAVGGGTVTSVTAGSGLTGGTITSIGTIAIDPASAVLTSNFFKQGGNGFAGTAILGSTNGTVEIISRNVRVMRIDSPEFQPTYGPSIAFGHANNAAGGLGATVSGGGIAAFPNSANANYATVSGGVNNKAQAEASSVGGGNNNTASHAYATVSGGILNTASGNRGTVGGGESNSAIGPFATVSGGTGNVIDAVGSYGVIAGGQLNLIQGTAPTNLGYATIGGGVNNKVLLGGGTVAGGNGNTVNGFDATVGGGNTNTANGFYATVPGGANNTATGNSSFAAGFRAKAVNNGCFAWADNTNADFTCALDNAFSARASGGVYLRTSGDLSTGCNLNAGSGTWACTSARETKTDFTAMNPLDVLRRVAGLSVTEWRYRAEASGARHVGPMAEDFHAAFGLGNSDKTISVVDAAGVALAAIQGLNQLVIKKDAEIQTQNKRIKLLEDALATIQTRLGMR